MADNFRTGKGTNYAAFSRASSFNYPDFSRRDLKAALVPPPVFVGTTKSEKGAPEYEMLNNPQPNTRYVLDKGTVFITNVHGYVDAISYQPVLNKQKRDSRQTKVGKEGLPDDVGGHIQACAMDWHV